MQVEASDKWSGQEDINGNHNYKNNWCILCCGFRIMTKYVIPELSSKVTVDDVALKLIL